MPIQFNYNELDVDLGELDELEQFVSEGDVDTDRVFADEEGESGDLSKNFDRVIVVENLPVVSGDKVATLRAFVNRIFTQAGAIQEGGLHLPVDSAGVSLGFAFVAYETSHGANQALKSMKDGFQMDKKHMLQVLPYTQLQSYRDWPQEYQRPVMPPYNASTQLDSWLLHPAQRDQYLLRHGNNTEIYWCEGPFMGGIGTMVYDGEREKQNGKIWCEMYTAWSPLGNYLATFHRQGIALWGGEKFERIGRFEHADVQHISFSPCEKYVFTWNGRDDDKDPRQLVCWEVKTGREIRTFKVGKRKDADTPHEWPIMQWSPDDQFFARMTENGVSVFESDSGKLMDKKPIKAKGIVSFEWSKSDPIFAYWAPEEDNLPARVVLVDAVTRTEVRSKNLYNVREVKLHWQNQGDFLCAQVLRHSKTGRTTFTNFEIFRMRDANYPNEMLEMKDMIEAFVWEPTRERFAMIHGESAHRLNVSFFTMGSIRGGSKIEKLYSLENKQVAALHWSPVGNAIILAGKSINGNIEFWDVDERVCTAEEEHFMCNEISWDPSGRMVATVVTQPMFGAVAMRYTLENGFNLWTFQGQLLRKEQMQSFYQFAWRPRPKSSLTEKDVTNVTRGLKTFMQKYTAEDEVRRKRLEAAANKEKIESLTLFRQLMERKKKLSEEYQAQRLRLGLEEVKGAEEFEEIIETEEVFVSEKVEPFMH